MERDGTRVCSGATDLTDKVGEEYVTVNSRQKSDTAAILHEDLGLQAFLEMVLSSLILNVFVTSF